MAEDDDVVANLAALGRAAKDPDALKPADLVEGSDFTPTRSGLITDDQSVQITSPHGNWRELRHVNFEDDVQRIRAGFMANNRIAPFDAAAALKPVESFPETMQARLRATQEWLTVLEDSGLENPLLSDNPAQFMTTLDLISLSTGIITDHRISHEASIAQWEDMRGTIKQYNNALDRKIPHLEESQMWLQFVDDFGQDLGEEFIEAMQYTFSENVDEEGRDRSVAQLAMKFQADPDKYRGIKGRNLLLTEWVQLTGQASFKHMVDTGQVTVEAPGWGEAWSALVGAAHGVIDVLAPESAERKLGEALPFFDGDFEGGIIEGGTTTLGAIGGTTIGGALLDVANTIFEPIDEYVTRPLKDWTNEFFMSDLEVNPYKAYRTTGQIVAEGAGLEYGSDWFHNMSGGIDASLTLLYDPLTYVVPFSKAASVASKGMRATEVVGLFGSKSRLALAGRAIIPNRAQRAIFGSQLPTAWKGMKGPLTRFYYYGMATPADELIKAVAGEGAKASTRVLSKIPFTPTRAAVQRAQGFVTDAANMIGEETEEFARLYNLQEANGLVKAFEILLDPIDAVDVNGVRTATAQAMREKVVLEAWSDAVNGVLPDPTKVSFQKIENIRDDRARNVNARLESAFRAGELSPLDFKTSLVGDHAWDGMFGFKLNETGRAVPVQLNGAQGEVLLFPTSVKRVEYDDLREMAKRGEAPEGLKAIFKERTQGAQMEVWENLTPHNQQAVFSYLEAQGFKGFKIGKRNNFFSDSALRRAVRTVDTEPRGAEVLNDLIGEPMNEYLTAQGAVIDVGSMTDNLDVVVNYGKVNSTKIYESFARGFKGKLKTGQYGTTRWSRNIGELTARTEGFPNAVNFRNLNKGIGQLKAIADRMGFTDEVIDVWVESFRKAHPNERFHVLNEIKKDMLTRSDQHRARYYIEGMTDDSGYGFGVDLQGEAIMVGPSKSRPGMLTPQAYQPSMMTEAVEFFGENFYKELGRLNVAKSLNKTRLTSPLVQGFGKTATNRKALVARYKEMMLSKVPDPDNSFAFLTDEDWYNMAYATVAKLDDGINGLGAISKASRHVSKWYKLAQSQFSILTLALRAPAWAIKVALFEEPIRGQLTASNRWYSNPIGALKASFEAAYIRQLQRTNDVPMLLSSMREAAITQIRSAADIDDAKRIAQHLLPDVNFDKIDSIPKLTERMERELSKALQDFDPTLGGRLSLVEANRRSIRRVERAGRLSEVSEFDFKLNDILSMGADNVNGAQAATIYGNSVTEQFVQRINHRRGAVAYNTADIKNYAVAKGNSAIKDVNDPFHRYALQYELARLTGGKKPPIGELINTQYWHQLRPQIKGALEADGLRYTTETELAHWYVTNVQARAIEAKWGTFWLDNKNMTKQEVIEGILDRNLKVTDDAGTKHHFVFSRGDERRAINAYDNYLQQHIDRGRGDLNMERQVYGYVDMLENDAFKKDWTAYSAGKYIQDVVNRKLRLTSAERADGTMRYGIMEYAGARATENVSRLPAWRKIYGDYRRQYDSLGWDARTADIAATRMATEQINNIYYNSAEMSKWLQNFNSVVPFGAAMVEVAKVWMWDIPKNYLGHGGVLGWTLGTMELQRRWQYITQAMEGMGLVSFEFDEESGRYVRHIVLDEDSESFWNKLALKGVKAPSELARMLYNNLTDSDMEGYTQMDFRLGNLTGGPFQTSNSGLFGLSQYQASVGPLPAWAMGKLAPALMSLPETIEYSGGSIADFLDENDMTLDEFLSVAENRRTLIEADVPLGRVNDILAAFGDEDNELPLDLLMEISDLEQVILPEGKYRKSNPGNQLGIFQDYIQPFGAPTSMAEAIGDYFPGGVQSALLGLENMLRDDEAHSISEFFFGPSSAYTHDREFLNGIMVSAIANGTLDEWQADMTELTDLRMEAIEKGLAEISKDPEIKGDRFRWIEYGEEQIALEERMDKAEEKMKASYETLAGDALTYAVGSHFMRAMTQLSLPSQPQRLTEQKKDVQNYWQSREFGQAIKDGLGPEAFIRWQQHMSTPEAIQNFSSVVLDFLKPVEWDPESDNRTQATWDLLQSSTEVRRGLRNNPALRNLHYYLTPNKVYPTGYVQTETIEEWADLVDQGALQFADPKVYVMRALNDQLSWEAGVERAAFFEGADWEKALTENEEWKNLNMDIRNRRDYLKFVDAEVFEGVYADSYEEAEGVADGKPDAEQIVRDHVLAKHERDIALLNRLIDDIDTGKVDVTDASEMRSTLQALRSEIFQLKETLDVLDNYSSSTPELRSLTQWYDTVAGPHYDVLTALYDDVDAAETDWERTIAYEAIRTYENNQFTSVPVVGNKETFNVMTLKEYKLVNEATETGVRGSDLEKVVRKQLGLKPDWLSWSDVSLIGAYVEMSGGSREAVDYMLPSTPQQWLPYIERNTQLAAVKQDRLDGVIKDKEAKKAVDAINALWEKKVKGEVEGYESRPGELEMAEMTPAEQFVAFGMLDPGFAPIMATAREYLDITNAKTWRGNKKDLWNQDYNLRIQSALNNNPMLAQSLREIGQDSYNESDLNAIAYRFFLGKFGDR